MEKYVRKEISADTARSYGQGQLVPILIPVSPADDDHADGNDNDDDDNDKDHDEDDRQGQPAVDLLLPITLVCCFQSPSVCEHLTAGHEMT